jgi:dsRNA-specific ribonuclease
MKWLVRCLLHVEARHICKDTFLVQGRLPAPPSPPKAGGAPVVKNAVTLLNEFCQKSKLDAPSYFFGETVATKTYTATVTVRGQSFIGRGSKKATAKHAAAEKALTQMLGLGGGALALRSTPTPTPPVVPLAAGSLPKDPVSILNELCQKRRLSAVYTFAHDSSFQDPKAVPLHITKLAVAGLIFVAKAPRKDAAKKAAAKAALEHFEGPVGKSDGESTPAQWTPTRLTGPSVTPQEIAALAQLLPGLKAEPQPSSVEKASISSSAVDISPQDQNSTLDASTPAPQPAQDAQPSSPGPVDASPGVTGDGGEEAGSPRRPSTTGAPNSGKRDYASLAATGKDPVCLLNEFTMRQGTHLEIAVRKLESAMPAFVAEFVLEGRSFSVEGASKADAKKGVADMVLQHLESKQPGTLESLKGGSAKRARKSEDDVQEGGEGSKGAETDRGGGPRRTRKRKADDVERQGSNPFADRLAGLACSKYRELTAGDTGQKGKQVRTKAIGRGPWSNFWRSGS